MAVSTIRANVPKSDWIATPYTFASQSVMETELASICQSIPENERKALQIKLTFYNPYFPRNEFIAGELYCVSNQNNQVYCTGIFTGASDTSFTMICYSNGTFYYRNIGEALYALIDKGGSHNGIFRGDNLGTLTTSNIDAFCTAHEISSGKFTDLYLGDYFTLQDGTYNKQWMVAAFDQNYNYKKNDSTWINFHSIAIIPRTAGILQKRYHSSDVTTGGVYNSELSQWLLNDFTNTMKNNVLTADHCGVGMCYLSSAADAEGKPTSVASGTGTCFLPTTMELFNSANVGSSTNVDGIGKHILPVFNFIATCEYDNGEYWLGGIYDSTSYLATRHGGANVYKGSPTATSFWVRPLMFIK